MRSTHFFIAAFLLNFLMDLPEMSTPNTFFDGRLGVGGGGGVWGILLDPGGKFWKIATTKNERKLVRCSCNFIKFLKINLNHLHGFLLAIFFLLSYFSKLFMSFFYFV